MNQSKSARPALMTGMAAREVAVWRRSGDGWQVVRGRIGGRALRLLSARTIQAGAGGPPHHAEATLVASGRRTVCRRMELPTVNRSEIREALALRLETELPYGGEEVAWAWQVQATDARHGKSDVLVVAAPAADVDAQCGRLAGFDRAPAGVETPQTALAQVADAMAADSTVAALDVSSDGTTIVLAREGCMACARHIPAGQGDQAHLAREVEQTLRHWAAGAARRKAQRLLVVGQEEMAERLCAELSDRLDLEPERPSPPGDLETEAGALREDFGAYAVCIGAVLAAHMRERGGQAAGPALRSYADGRQGRKLRRLVALGALNIVLVVALIVAAFALRRARLRAVRAEAERARAALQDYDVLAEEVAILQAEGKEHRSTLDIVYAITEALPKAVQLTDVQIAPRGEIAVQGTGPSVEALSEAAARLEESDRFEEASLERVSSGERGMTFRMNCTLR